MAERRAAGSDLAKTWTEPAGWNETWNLLYIASKVQH